MRKHHSALLRPVVEQELNPLFDFSQNTSSFRHSLVVGAPNL
ncbi:hypothetical protein [Bifidobacterium crudilactis]|jgi:hypothetical protein|nr:hypothetical protein [Bifidobacterium crudilactis]